MNLEEGLAKEGEMRPRLLTAIAEQHQLDAKSVAKVDACMLGNWLHGEAERTCQFIKNYRPCVEAHDAFHFEAEKVARQVNLGEYAHATGILGSGTPCTKAFLAMVAAVSQLKLEVKL